MEKLITQFGCQSLTPTHINRIISFGLNCPSSSNLDSLYNSGMIVSHRDLDILLDSYENGDRFYIYTGRGPSSGSLHIGHLIPFLTAKYLQDIFDAPVFIQLSTDEKYLRDNLSLEEVEAMARSNAHDIMSLQFNPDKTLIISNFSAIEQLYPTTMNILRHITVKQMTSTFGINDGDKLGNYYFPAIEAAPAFHCALTGIIDNHPRCLVVLGLDQDPYFRLARDVAHNLKCPKPALIHTNFIPGLKDLDSKMSSSDPLSAIFLSDTDHQIKTKINRHAFSGGRNTAEEQRALGANVSVDVSCRYLQIFAPLVSDINTNEIIEKYSKGEILTGSLKNILIAILQQLITQYRINRVSNTTLDLVTHLHNIT